MTDEKVFATMKLNLQWLFATQGSGVEQSVLIILEVVEILISAGTGSGKDYPSETLCATSHGFNKHASQRASQEYGMGRSTIHGRFKAVCGMAKDRNQRHG